MHRVPRLALLLFAVALGLAACGPVTGEPRVLVFTKAEGYRHASTDEGVSALRELGRRDGFSVTATDDASRFSEDSLRHYAAVVFLNTSGDVLDHAQQAEFERYVQAGGGFVGIHAAAETEADWPWYGRLVGASLGRPAADVDRVTEARLRIVASGHAATEAMAEGWRYRDAWYGFDSVGPDAEVLVAGGEGEARPFAWVHAYDGGRAFYVAGGHTPEAFADSSFRSLLSGGLRYVLDGDALDYRRATTRRLPEENRFSKVVLADALDEPTELALLGGGRVLFVQRKGAVRLYDPSRGEVRTIARLDVHTEFEDGLMGVATDPDFEDNGWIYLYYSPAGDEAKQHLSRFELRGDSLLLDTEKVLLEVPTQRETCCHTGGSLAFGPDGTLYLSTGDDTNPFESSGFAPIDERPGRRPFDAQRSSANTDDLRGKILRIRPEPDGTYSIPEGNLFVDDDPSTRPEIYVMGNRNPYRIAVDQRTGCLYWGEVGPDAGRPDPERGPAGHDEVNRACGPGFYGWPLFVGDNKPYRDYDFAAGTPADAFDASAPVNDSPNNSGLQALPPAQPAMIWYPYGASPEFPIVGTGGRTAMAGPVFYRDAYDPVDETLPGFYDGKLFIYEWMRGWIMAVTLDEDGRPAEIAPFMPSTAFNNPVDMAFDEHGVMYLLEYGTGWFSQNPDARLVRIAYNPGNRAPVVRVAARPTMGADPLTVQFSTEGTKDFDGDVLTYAWHMTGGENVQETGASPSFTYERPGIYEPRVAVTDEAGNTAEARLEVRVGNAPPQVDLHIEGNRSFYWDDRTLDYTVEVSDPEDEAAGAGVDPADAFVQFEFVEQGVDPAVVAAGHQASSAVTAFSEGQGLIEGSDCMACHSYTAQSIGPSFRDVAMRYAGETRAVEYLVTKVIEGGGGVWGDQAMAAHPQLSEGEAARMVEYILGLGGDGREREGLPPSGTFAPRAHVGEGEQGAYVLRAAYTDRGAGGIGPLTGQDVIVLRHPRVQAEDFDVAGDVGTDVGYGEAPGVVDNLFDGTFVGFHGVDLQHVERLTFRALTRPRHRAGGTIAVRLDAPDGPVVGRATVPPGGDGEQAHDVVAAVEPMPGVHDLYLTFENDRARNEALFVLDWVQFHDE